VILCGGAGTRLWPLSRQAYPKQLLSVVGDESLLQQTAQRLSGAGFTRMLVVGGEDQSAFIKTQLDAIGADVDSILLEPEGRNTAAAATLAAAWLMEAGADELMLLMPSDHVINDREAFLAAVEKGIPHAEQGGIVTFGAEASEPSTQYGYIEADQKLSDGAFRIARFHEKPNAEKAVEYLATDRFYWNAGIFLAKAQTLLDQMRQFLPASLDTITEAVSRANSDGLFVRPAADAFARADNVSIDNGIMEKTEVGVVVPVDMQWSDVGAWDAVWKLGEKDESGNVIQGDVVTIDTSGSLIRNEGGPLIATIGLSNVAIIAAGDAIFIAPLARVAEVKKLVDRLRSEGRECVVFPPGAARGSPDESAS
jgi:mannose-1-phosphate guanylyltransferase/mannose-6-phosphate isomerase